MTDQRATSQWQGNTDWGVREEEDERFDKQEHSTGREGA